MKKSIFCFSLLSTLVFASEYTQSLDMLLNDAKTFNSFAMSSLNETTKSETKLNMYETKLNGYADELANFSIKQVESFSSKKEAQEEMDTLNALSTQIVVMAKELTYISSHQADNVSDDYKSTLKTVASTTLRLSDDIGTMSDRILIMADKIGVMADRIVKTQEIQSRNLDATTKLVKNAMQLTSTQTESTRNMSVMKISQAQNMNSVQEMPQSQNMSGRMH